MVTADGRTAAGRGRDDEEEPRLCASDDRAFITRRFDEDEDDDRAAIGARVGAPDADDDAAAPFNDRGDDVRGATATDDGLLLNEEDDAPRPPSGTARRLFDTVVAAAALVRPTNGRFAGAADDDDADAMEGTLVTWRDFGAVAAAEGAPGRAFFAATDLGAAAAMDYRDRLS